jgi:hypothetical protein
VSAKRVVLLVVIFFLAAILFFTLILTLVPQNVMYGILIVMPFSAAILAWWAWRRKYPKVRRVRSTARVGDSPDERWVGRRLWEDHLWPPMVIAAVCSDVTLLLLWPHWSKRVFTENWWKLFILDFFIFVGMWMIPESPEARRRGDWKKRSAHLTIAFGMLGVLYLWGILPWLGEPYWEKKWDEAKSVSLSDVVVQNYDFPLTLANNPEARATYDFWMKESGLSAHDGYLMFLICGHESGYRQYEADGLTPLKGKVDPDDTGICQVNKRMAHHEDKSIELTESTGKDHRLETLQGNLNMSLWIFQNEGGAKRWSTYNLALAELGDGQFLYAGLVPVLGWKKVTPLRPFKIYPDGPINIRTSDGRIVSADKGSTFEIGVTRTLEFQSRKDPVKVTVVE